MDKEFLFKNLKIYKLDNGLTVILRQYPKLPIVSLQVWIKAGSIYETVSNNGISHFLEHLVFKGTKNYKVGEISKITEKYGAILNAGTSKEFTMYFTDIPKEGLNDALNIISELVFEAIFPSDELEKERNVVIEEIKRSEDNPGNVLYENFNSLLFTESSYKFRVIGTSENIKNFSRDEIIEYYKTFYQPQNMILSISGDINFTEIEPMIKNIFEKYDKGEITVSLPNEEKKKPEIVKIKKHKVQHTYFISGFLGPNINDKLQYAGDVLSIILGEGRSSRFYRLLREKKRLSYEIATGFYTQVGQSIFYVSGVCERKKLEPLIEEIKSELKKIVSEGVTEQELEKARQIVITRWYFGNETVHSQASNLAWWYMFKSLDELKEYVNNIAKVTNEDIKTFVRLYGDQLVVSALEP